MFSTCFGTYNSHCTIFFNCAIFLLIIYSGIELAIIPHISRKKSRNLVSLIYFADDNFRFSVSTWIGFYWRVITSWTHSIYEGEIGMNFLVQFNLTSKYGKADICKYLAPLFFRL